MKRALENKLGVILVSGLAIVFLIGVVQCQLISRLMDADRQSTRSREVLAELALTRSLLDETEADAGAYAATREETYLQSSQSAALRISESLHHLRGLWTDDSGQRKRLDALEPLVAPKGAKERQEGLARRGPKTPGPRQPTTAGAGTQAGEVGRQMLRRMEEEERGRLVRRSSAARVAGWEAVLSTTVGSGLALWLIILTGLVLRHYVGQRRRTDLDRSLSSQLLESMAEGVWLSDESGLILYANPACEAMLGYMSGELPGRNLTLLIDCRQQNGLVVEEIRQRLESHAVWRGELTGHRKDRSPFSWYARISGLEVSGRLHWVGVQEDAPQGWYDSKRPVLDPLKKAAEVIGAG
ncbi:MAG TPA: CHASE3 domain-containing protein [Terriglobia bacterium]|nr:CHASE3 domain-containing protein [Terriglobia bacterium]